MRRLIVVLGTVIVSVALVVGSPASAEASTYPSFGDRGPAVRALQKRLVRAQVLEPRFVTGHYRRPTKRAVARFQRREHLRVTGRVNRWTWRRLVLRTTAPPPPLPPAPIVIGHRGAVLPGLGEETIAAMQRAVADGAAALEFDVRWTEDDVAVALHGDALESVSNCSGSVTTWTAQELADQCTVEGQPIAHVSDLVAYAKQVQIPISPEVKPASITSAEAADLAAMLADTTTYLQSFSTSVFAPLRAAGYTGPFVYLTTTSVSPEAVGTAGAAIVAQMFSGSLTAAQVRTYHDAGLKVWAWTARSTSELGAARTYRVDAVVADDPGAARTFYAAQRG